MAEFDPEEFYENITYGKLTKLSKDKLWQLMEYLELEAEEETKKPDLVHAIWVFADPEAKKQEKERLKEEAELERARLNLEREKLQLETARAQRRHEARFDFNSCLRLMPKFNDDEVSVFFDAFERIAKELQWPEDKWTTLVQCVLVGKAQEAYASLDAVQSRDYDIVRQAVLAAYEMVPEAYRQQFRSLRKQSDETFLDLARKQELVFERWLASTKTFTFQELKALILMEQFHRSVPSQIETHLNNTEVKEVRKAAMLADQYELTHCNISERGRPFRQDKETERRAPGFKKFPDRRQRPHVKSERASPPPEFKRVERPPRTEVYCFYCRKPGHIKSACRKLQHREASKSIACISVLPQVLEPTKFVDPSEEEVLKDYQGFVSQGVVAVSEDSQEVPVKVLRDSGAAHSLLLKGVLDLPPSTATGVSIIVKGVGDRYVPAPKHRFFVKTELVTGVVAVGVIDTLPVKGITFLLGNDLAGSRVRPSDVEGTLLEVSQSESVTPIIQEQPCEAPQTVALEQEHPEVFTACVVTRSGSQSQKLLSAQVEEPFVNLSDTFLAQLTGIEEGSQFTREALIKAQCNEPSIAALRKTAMSLEESKEVATGYYLHHEVLMRKWRPPRRPADEHWAVLAQVVLPGSFRDEAMRLAHESAWAGHLGVRKTQDRVMRHFYWPTVRRDVVSYCRSCHTCQLVGKPNQSIPVAPLSPPPVMEEPFSRVMIDCVGPLPRTKKGNEYLLTIMDVGTKFPEAVPLRTIKTRGVVEALLQFFSRVGLPKEIQHDRGTNFTSNLFQEVVFQLGIKQVMSSAYHPQSQGAIERCHQTLKTMIKAYCMECPEDWDMAMPFLLFAIRDATNESTGFSPFELVYGHEVRGPLKMMKEKLIELNTQSDTLQYVATFKDRLQSACAVARQNLQAAKSKMKQQYDKKAVQRTFVTGDKVLVLLPMNQPKLGLKFCGPYTVVKRVGECNYVVSTPERRQKTRLCHINLLKSYVERNSESPVCLIVSAESSEPDGGEDGPEPPEPVSARLLNTELLANVSQHLDYLPLEQAQDIVSLIKKHPGLFKDTPGLTNLVSHDVDTGEAAPIKQHPYRIPPYRQEAVKAELQYMLEIGAIEKGSSAWSSPLVPVLKSDNTVRPCIDFRKVNSVTKTDAFPIPRLEDCIDRIGQATFVSKFDLLKGYWQVPLTHRAKQVSAFCTADQLYLCRVLPFGMKNAPATFQRLMNNITAGLANVVTYIDDVVVYSSSWKDHVVHINQLFERLGAAGLVVNLPKCEFGKGQVTYLGHLVGRGSVRPRQAKVQAIVDLPTPTTKRQLMRLLGMSGFYRRFVPNFADVVAPLTNLLKKNVKFVWTPECQSAVEKVKVILSCEPVLKAPDFSVPFRLATDASDLGIGAVLLQADSQGIEKPVAYYSKKLNPHQRLYSTIEKEALALVLAIQHFEFYVAGSQKELLVYTDHNPLVFVEKFKGKNQRLFRWSLVLQPYNLVIQHLPGKLNVIADALSRG